MDNVKVIDGVIAEMETLRDSLEFQNAAMHIVYKRWILDLKNIWATMDSQHDIAILRSDYAAAVKREAELEKQVTELTSQLAAAKAAAQPNYASEARHRMVAQEIESMEAAGKLNEFLMHVVNRSWINAIKLYRAHIGGGLKDAKDRVEAIAGWNK